MAAQNTSHSRPQRGGVVWSACNHPMSHCNSFFFPTSFRILPASLLPILAYAGGRSLCSAASSGPQWSGGRWRQQLGSGQGCGLEKREARGDVGTTGSCCLSDAKGKWPGWKSSAQCWCDLSSTDIPAVCVCLHSHHYYPTHNNFSTSKKYTFLP